MSTLGKVLSVITVIFLLIALFLSSLVTDLNTNWTQKLDRLQTKDIPQAQESLAKAEADRDAAKLASVQLQQQKLRELRYYKEEGERLKRAEAMSLESLTNFTQEREAWQASIEGAKAEVARHRQDIAGIQKSTAETEKLVAALKAQDATLRADLQRLRDEFKTLLAENRRMVDDLRSRSGNAPRTRPATFIRVR